MRLRKPIRNIYLDIPEWNNIHIDKAMSTYRIYVDSCGNTDGTDTDFTFELPYSIAIKEKSLAMMDVVCVPNSILTVTENLNDTIWLKETKSFDEFHIRFCKLVQGYYTVQTLRAAIEVALNTGTFLFHQYTVGFDERLQRHTFSNPFTISGESFTLYTAQSLKKPVPENYPDIVGPDYGAFRQVGLVEGGPVFCNPNTGPVTATGCPNLQANTQLFIRSSLGIPATSVGPLGNMSIARRVVLDAPLFGLCVDRHTTSWDSIAIPGHITISTISLSLCGYNMKPVDLQGQPWSCSITIFRE